MGKESQYTSKCLGIAWIGIVLLITLKIFLSPPTIKTDITELILSNQSSESSSLLSPRIIAENANKLLFVIEGNSIEEVQNAKTLLEDLIFGKFKLDLKLIDSTQALEQLMEDNSGMSNSLLDFPTITRLNQANSFELIKSDVLRKLNSPLSSFYANFLEKDPLLLLADNLINQRKGIVGEFSEDGIINHFDDKINLTFPIEITKTNLDFETRNTLFAQINAAVASIRNGNNSLDIKWTGFSKFAHSSKSRIEQEINILSTFSTLGIFILILYFFRSFKPIFFTTISVIAGLVTGVACVIIQQNSIHLLTIGFGSCLLGASVDYALHFQSEAYFFKNNSLGQVRNKVLWPITLGVITTILSFAALIYADFPGLNELSLFSIGSLLGSYLSVILIFPLFKSSWMEAKENRNYPGFKITKIIEERLNNKGTIRLLSILAIILLSYGLSILKFNDDIKLLQPQDKALLEETIWIQARTNLAYPSAQISFSDSVTLQTRAKLHAELLKLKMDGKLKGYFDSNPLYRTKTESSESRNAFRRFLLENEGAIKHFLNEIGTNIDQINKLFDISDTPNQSQKNQSIGNISLYGVQDKEVVKKSLESAGAGEANGIHFFDHASEISKLFSSYRAASIKYTAYSYCIIFLILSLIHGPKKGAKGFIATSIGALLSIATLGALGIPVSFFTILALIIVLGLGVDYSIFLLENKDHSYTSKISVLLSVLSTAITFGLFTFSSTPVLKTFSIVITLGVCFSYISASILLKPKQNLE